MVTVKLGRTGLEVNPVGFGGIPIQRISLQDAGDLVEYAIQQGINFIDTARIYTDSEVKIGQILSKYPQVMIASKSMARDQQTMAEDIKISLENLQINCIDLYQCHNVRSQEELQAILSKDGAYSALSAAKAAGLIKFIGITGHKPALLVEALKSGKFDTVQVPFNIIETEALEELFPLCQERNIGIIIMKPIAGGALKDHAQSSLKYILSQQESVVIPGMDTKEQIDANLSILNDPTLSASQTKELQDIADSLGSQFCRRCDYCAPCPQKIDIPSMFILNGYFSRYNMSEWATNRYQSLKINAGDCLQCGQCELKCPYELPIMEMLKEVHQNLAKDK